MDEKKSMGERFLEILKKLEEEEQHRSDIVLPLKQVRMMENGLLETSEGQVLKWGEHSFGQFCTELNMPAKYMRRLMTEKPDFVAQQANYFLNKVDNDVNRRFRLYDDKIQGIVSEKYVPYDDIELFSEIHQLLPRLPHGHISSFYRDDKRTQMKILFPEVRKNVGVASEEDGNKDTLIGGITIQNSQVGYSLIKSIPLVWRMVCSNGMMGWGEGENGLKQRHIHFDPQTIRKQLEDGVLVAVDSSERMINRMEKAREIVVENPYEEIAKHAKRMNLSKAQAEKVKEAFGHERQNNLYGVVNAFTRFARDIKSNETQAEVELFAGQLLRQVA